MNILLTNDDGIYAEGLMVLYEVLSEYNTVYIIAPDSERSACSNAVTLRDEMTIYKISENKFSITGYPADCVNIALHSGIIPDVDMVISGINHGPNVGDDIYFSGTVAGARTGFIFGKTGIAVSLDSYHRPSKYFHDASRFIVSFIDQIKEEIINSPLLFNINYPDLPSSQIVGTQYTQLGKRIYNDSYDLSPGFPASIKVRTHGAINSIKSDGSDVTELEKGYITITPLNLNSADIDYLKLKRNVFYDRD